MPPETYKGKKTVRARSRAEWRKWLQKNHLTSDPVWLIIYKKDSGVKTVYYPEAVDEALCFGWIDSTVNKRDEESYYQYFTKRKAKSVWSKINKNKIKTLIKDGLMTQAGLDAIAVAKKNGSWNTLNAVDSLSMSEDLKRALTNTTGAKKNWESLSDSAKKRILYWLQTAKLEETRKKRLAKITEAAKQGLEQLRKL